MKWPKKIRDLEKRLATAEARAVQVAEGLEKARGALAIAEEDFGKGLAWGAADEKIESIRAELNRLQQDVAGGEMARSLLAKEMRPLADELTHEQIAFCGGRVEQLIGEGQEARTEWEAACRAAGRQHLGPVLMAEEARAQEARAANGAITAAQQEWRGRHPGVRWDAGTVTYWPRGPELGEDSLAALREGIEEARGGGNDGGASEEPEGENEVGG